MYKEKKKEEDILDALKNEIQNESWKPFVCPSDKTHVIYGLGKFNKHKRICKKLNNVKAEVIPCKHKDCPVKTLKKNFNTHLLKCSHFYGVNFF